MRSDKVDGFILDRGFQIFLTSYPTAKEMLDYNALDLKPFYAGEAATSKSSLPVQFERAAISREGRNLMHIAFVLIFSREFGSRDESAQAKMTLLNFLDARIAHVVQAVRLGELKSMAFMILERT